MTVKCPCGQPSPDAFLCRGCSLRLERALRGLPALIVDLDVTLTRQAVTGAHSEGKPTKADSQPLSLNLAAADVAHDLRHTLVSAIRHLTEARGIVDHGPWCEERKWHAPLVWRTCGGCATPKDNPTSMARWLWKYRDSIRLDPAGPDIAEAIHAIKARIFAVIGPEPDIRIKVGQCPEMDEDGRLCPGGVWASIPREGPATMECRACGTAWPAIEWEQTGKRIMRRGAA